MDAAGSEDEYVLWAKAIPGLTGIKQDPDLRSASMWPEAETVTLSAIVSWFLHGNLFQMPIYGVASAGATFISDVKEIMSGPNFKSGRSPQYLIIVGVAV